MTVQSILKQKGLRVQTMTPEALVSDAARVLSDQRIGILVVCDERNKVVGVLSERDLCTRHRRASGVHRRASRQ